MTAEFVDALQGYEYYLKERGKLTIDQVNMHLKNQGRKSISARTYGHYIKLLREGFRNYIPVNQFDVYQTLGRLQMAADRRRYGRENSELIIQVSVDRVKWQNGTVINQSLVGFGILLEQSFDINKSERIWIRKDGYKDIPGTLVWKKIDKNVTQLGIRAFEFIAKYQLEEEEIVKRLTGVLNITRSQVGKIGWEQLNRMIGQTNLLLTTLNELIYSLDAPMGTKTKLARPILDSINFGSAGELQAKIDFGVAEILKTLIEKFQYWHLDKEKYIHENRTRELENANLGIEVVRNAIKLKSDAINAGMSEEAISFVLEPIKSVFKVKELPKGLFETGTLERGVLLKRVLPIIAELLAGDDPDFKIKVFKTK